MRRTGSGRPNPSFVGILNFTTPNAAGSIDDGLQVSIQHRFAQNFSASAAYTLARLKDSTTGAFYYPNNQYNLAAEWANSPDNQGNTMTLSAAYQMKWDSPSAVLSTTDPARTSELRRIRIRSDYLA